MAWHGLHGSPQGGNRLPATQMREHEGAPFHLGWRDAARGQRRTVSATQAAAQAEPFGAADSARHRKARNTCKDN